jgi:hypothetical protein
MKKNNEGKEQDIIKGMKHEVSSYILNRRMNSSDWHSGSMFLSKMVDELSKHPQVVKHYMELTTLGTMMG